jgi:hypothetical protein
MRWLVFAAVAALVVPTVGCARPHSRVHGKITYRGTPVAGGTIIFMGPDNQTYPARIGSDGSYNVASVPRGHLQISIQADQPRIASRPQPGAKDSDSFAKGAMNLDDQSKGGPGANQPAAGAFVAVPARYADPTKSDLTVDLEQSDQEYSVDLK